MNNVYNFNVHNKDTFIIKCLTGKKLTNINNYVTTFILIIYFIFFEFRCNMVITYH